jgi:lipopolysaccharide assembly protein A
MRAFTWLLRGFIFLALFAFALNNQQAATIHWFFGVQWQAPMVIIVLLAFAAGCGVGVMAMLPAWWRQRRAHAAVRAASAQPTSAPLAAATVSAEPGVAPSAAPFREGL